MCSLRRPSQPGQDLSDKLWLWAPPQKSLCTQCAEPIVDTNLMLPTGHQGKTNIPAESYMSLHFFGLFLSHPFLVSGQILCSSSHCPRMHTAQGLPSYDNYFHELLRAHLKQTKCHPHQEPQPGTLDAQSPWLHTVSGGAVQPLGLTEPQNVDGLGTLVSFYKGGVFL